MLEKQWQEMTADEKRAARFQKWLSSPMIKFASQKAEKAYKNRTQRFIDAIELKKAPAVAMRAVMPTANQTPESGGRAIPPGMAGP